MKALNLITLILIIVGGLNWGLVGLTDANFVTGIASLFGSAQNAVAKLIYVIVGLSAVYQIAPLSQAFSVGEVSAERGRY
ncbi:uncharacterized membrane protein YuzA (DUF378 family) [Rhodoblastus acidophilus]|uniref:DUF378 domain-containing protein n=1 Tax=Rhodoblastus acidophilus TaxID=1074 RepID=UPI0016192FB7|nr:DUF378 domain-containing protein [Rhodoblastus acidophilus]MCW2285524.1 uncharacterized membrane protein YuzA (DUF378 family) [Rhodoblastus acidophilus]MCW2334560.1 uncharacterized membrane protein YuzA (DUF378 family) [Rhodoblastus acidophilus]